MFNLDPKKMQQMMRQLGIKQEEIDANRVIIEQDDKNIVIDNPSISKINMQGQETWQIIGEAREEEKSGITEEDIKRVMEKTGCTRQEAEEKLKETEGDLAQAIIELSR